MKSILLIEDSGVFREVEVTLLKSIEQIVVKIAVNFKESISHIDKYNFDLIICDYHLPDGVGLDILNHVRENNKKTKKELIVPFLMVTGNNDIGIVKECITKGVTDYLVKPLQPQIFLKKCCQHLDVPVPKL